VGLTLEKRVGRTLEAAPGMKKTNDEKKRKVGQKVGGKGIGIGAESTDGEGAKRSCVPGSIGEITARGGCLKQGADGRSVAYSRGRGGKRVLRKPKSSSQEEGGG